MDQYGSVLLTSLRSRIIELLQDKLESPSSSVVA